MGGDLGAAAMEERAMARARAHARGGGAIEYGSSFPNLTQSFPNLLELTKVTR
jgi:hypothetical protein